MLIFQNSTVAGSTLSNWPPLTELDLVKVLEGVPMHRGAHHYGNFGEPLQVGVWECTPGKFEYTYPGNEICTVLSGRVEITDAQGRRVVLIKGDILFTTKGETVTWDIKDTVRKAFLIC